MNRRLSFAVVAMLFAVLSTSRSTAAEPPTQAEIEKLILGKWFQEVSGNGVSVKTTISYQKDRTLSGDATITKGDRTVKVTIVGTWKVAGSKLIETYDKSDPPIFPPGKQSTDEVIEITEKMRRHRTEDGKEQTSTRVSE